MIKTALFTSIAVVVSAAQCGQQQAPAAKKGTTIVNSIVVTSRAFKNMQPLPVTYACDGEDVSPPLAWSGVPSAAKSLVLIADDPDAPAGTWVHWVLYDLPASLDSLEENVPKTDTLANGGRQGITDFRRIGYGGPCPPSGTHRYFFRLFALDVILGLPPGKTRRDIDRAMQGHIIASGELVGTYSRAR